MTISNEQLQHAINVSEEYGDEDAAKMPIDEVENRLREYGIDPEEAVQHVRSRVEKAIAHKRMELARENRQSNLRKLGEMPTNVGRRISELLSSLQSRNQEQAHVFMRKFEGATETDKASLLEDLEALEMLEEQENGED